MKRVPSVDPLDILAIVGLALLATAAGLRFGVEAALAVVGAAFLIYAYLSTRGPA